MLNFYFIIFNRTFIMIIFILNYSFWDNLYFINYNWLLSLYNRVEN